MSIGVRVLPQRHLDALLAEPPMAPTQGASRRRFDSAILSKHESELQATVLYLWWPYTAHYPPASSAVSHQVSRTSSHLAARDPTNSNAIVSQYIPCPHRFSHAVSKLRTQSFLFVFAAECLRDKLFSVWDEVGSKLTACAG